VHIPYHLATKQFQVSLFFEKKIRPRYFKPMQLIVAADERIVSCIRICLHFSRSAEVCSPLPVLYVVDIDAKVPFFLLSGYTVALLIALQLRQCDSLEEIKRLLFGYRGAR